MRAKPGDRIHMQGFGVSHPDTVGVIDEVKGTDGQPPYVVRFYSGRQELVYPGPRTEVAPQ